MIKFGKMDIRQMQDFNKKLQSLEDPEIFMKACAKELAARLLRQVTKRTPVGQYPEESGKMGGTLRRGWTASKSASGNAAAAYANAIDIRHEGGMYIVDIINPVEYATYVEYGHRTVNHKRWVPGQFMMTISEQEVEKAAPKILEAKIEKYMRKLGM